MEIFTCSALELVVRTQMSISNKVDATLSGSDTESDLSTTFSSKKKKSICSRIFFGNRQVIWGKDVSSHFLKLLAPLDTKLIFQSDHFVLSTNFLFKFNVSLPLVTGELLQNTVDVNNVTYKLYNIKLQRLPVLLNTKNYLSTGQAIT